MLAKLKYALIAGLTFHLVSTILVAEAQQGGTVRRVGFLSDAVTIGPLDPGYLEAFREGLRAHGWLDGRNVSIDFRESGTAEQRPETFAQLLRGKPEVIVTTGAGAFVIHPSPSQRVPGWVPVRDIPIVFAGQSNSRRSSS